MRLTRRELRERWVKALRSGEYKQATGALTQMVGPSELGYCCLGVATDLVFQECDNPFTKLELEQSLNESSYLPDRVMQLLGMVTHDGSRIDASSDQDNLAEENDGGASFDQIADMLETGDYWDPIYNEDEIVRC